MNDDFGSVVIASNEADDDFTMLDLLDHLLNTGVVVRGSLVISLAGVDLVYVGLDVILTSIETAMHQTLLPASFEQHSKRPK